MDLPQSTPLFWHHFLPLLVSWMFCYCQHLDSMWLLNLGFCWNGTFLLVSVAFYKFFGSLLMSNVRVTMKKCLSCSENVENKNTWEMTQFQLAFVKHSNDVKLSRFFSVTRLIRLVRIQIFFEKATFGQKLLTNSTESQIW